jgi:sigma-B regulation protein RsbU (phosphoserine phosphatase)
VKTGPSWDWRIGRAVGEARRRIDIVKDRRAATQADEKTAERDLEIGRQIQASFLPASLPELPGWEIAGRLEAARMVAGDFYDAFPLSGGKRLGLLVGDVTDKGVGAALFMALFRSLIRAFADQHYSLGWMDLLDSDALKPRREASVGRRRELLSTGATALKNAIDLTNNYNARNHGQTNMFATIFFAILDPSTGALMYINAGHEPPLLAGAGAIRARLDPTGPAVGLFPELDFAIEQVTIQPGELLLAFTDGVLDARSPAGVPFGEAGLEAAVCEPVPSAAALLDRLHARLAAHTLGSDPFDDITLLAVRRL